MGKEVSVYFYRTEGEARGSISFNFYFFSWPLTLWPSFSISKALYYINIGEPFSKTQASSASFQSPSGILRSLAKHLDPRQICVWLQVTCNGQLSVSRYIWLCLPMTLSVFSGQNFPREKWYCPWLFSQAISHKAKHASIEKNLPKPRIILKKAYNPFQNYTNNSGKKWLESYTVHVLMLYRLYSLDLF